MLFPLGSRSKQYYLTRLPPSKRCGGWGMWMAFQSVPGDGKQRQGGKPSRWRSSLRWSRLSAHLPGLFTEKLHSRTFLCISLTLKTYTDSSITTADVSTGSRDDFYLLCLFSPWLQRFSSNFISITKELAKNERAETEVKGCCASHKPIIKHRFDSIIHVLWWTTHK